MPEAKNPMNGFLISIYRPVTKGLYRDGTPHSVALPKQLGTICRGKTCFPD